MSPQRPTLPAALALAILAILGAAPAPAVAQTAQGTPSAAPADAFRNELVVFGGASLLDATRSRDLSIGLPEFPGDFPFPGGGSLDLRTESSLGSSALFGARYSRYVKERLAVEADFAVAPTHSLSIDGEVCLPGRGCYGRDDFGGAGAGARFEQALGRFGGPMRGSRGSGMQGGRFEADWRPGRDVTAWHYGAGLAYDVTGGDVRPVVTLGAGGVSWSGVGETSTDFVLRFGVGLKVLFGRVGARVDVVDHLVIDQYLSGEAEHDVHATAGLLVRF